MDKTPASQFTDKCVHWICKCHICNSTKSVSGKLLRNGNAISCGCVKSFGEQIILKYLNEHNIQYKKEFSFSELRDKLPLKFDFALYEENKLVALIEFNGAQHYKENRFFDGFGKDDLSSRQEHDLLKEDYCLANGLNLYIIEDKTSLEKSKLQYNLQVILDYIIKDIKGDNQYGKISNIDVRDVQG